MVIVSQCKHRYYARNSVLLHLAVIYFICKNDKLPMLISFGTFSMLNYIYWGVILRRNKNCCNLSGVSQKLHVRWLAYERNLDFHTITLTLTGTLGILALNGWVVCEKF